MTREPGRAIEDVRGRLRAAGLDAEAWSNGPGVTYAVHEHGYDKVLAVESGSITFTLPEATAIALHPGERLDLPAGTSHGAVVGRDGVVCLEAHLPAGTLAATPAARGRDW